MSTFCLIILCLTAASGVVVGLVATLVFVIAKKRRAWRIALATTLMLLLAGSVGGMVLIVRGVRTVGDIAAQTGEKIEIVRKEAAARRKVYEDHMATLKSYVDPKVLPAVDPMYWENLGAWDWYRFPTVYPYSIEAIDTLDHGMLTMWDAQRARDGGGFTSLVSGITDLSFDRRFLLARTEQDYVDSKKPHPVSWVLFDFQSGKSQTFGSREELEQAATAAGYQGDLESQSVRERYEACCP